MVEKTVKIVNKLGMHARPAALLVETATRFESEIILVKDDLEINGKSIMGVLMLAAEYGSTILIRAKGDDAKEAVEAIAALIKNKFNEP
jgi:phosphocarrier protein